MILKGGFKYGRLSNICYWCERVTYDDKDCPIWLKSKGALKMEDQQFGECIRAVQFKPSRKSYVEVKGFGEFFSKKSEVSSVVSRTQQPVISSFVSNQLVNVSLEGRKVGGDKSSFSKVAGVNPVVVESDVRQLERKLTEVRTNSNMGATANFKEKLKEVDEEFSVDYVFPNLTSDLVEVDKVAKGDSKSTTFKEGLVTKEFVTNMKATILEKTMKGRKSKSKLVSELANLNPRGDGVGQEAFGPKKRTWDRLSNKLNRAGVEQKFEDLLMK